MWISLSDMQTYTVRTVWVSPVAGQRNHHGGLFHLRDFKKLRKIRLTLSYPRLLLLRSVQWWDTEIETTILCFMFPQTLSLLCCFGSGPRTKHRFVLLPTGFLRNTRMILTVVRVFNKQEYKLKCEVSLMDIRSKFTYARISGFAEGKNEHLWSYVYILLKTPPSPPPPHTHTSVPFSFPDLCISKWNLKWNNPFCLHTGARWDKRWLHCIQKWSRFKRSHFEELNVLSHYKKKLAQNQTMFKKEQVNVLLINFAQTQ